MDNLIISNEHNGVLLISINRLDKKNALNNDMYIELCRLFTLANERDDIRCVLIQGDEKCFCAGNDLHDFIKCSESGDLAAFDLIKALAALEKPLVAAVAGPAVGIGTTLLLHCDMVYAANNAKFKLPFAQLGLCPEAGSSLLLPLRIGHNRAFELLVLGKMFTAEQALDYGLINEICAEDTLLSTALNTAQSIAKLPLDALLTSRKLMKANTQALLPQVMAKEAEQFKRLVNTQECKSILASFFK